LWAVLQAVLEVDESPPLMALFQPREEVYPSGALDVVKSGLLRDWKCKAMVGVHVQPALDAGVVACAPGGVNASSDEFQITVNGVSGHSAYPHRTHDPIAALANIVTAVHTIAPRMTDPTVPIVLGISSLYA